MITRRNFIITSAATASSPMVSDAAADDTFRTPPRAMPRVRTIHAEPAPDGRLLLVSDGPKAPPKLIKSDALEKAFGPGTDRLLYQPDHWRMIEEGWFSEADLYRPTDIDDPANAIWHANYRPEVEAHDLLYDLFQDRIVGPFGCRIPELGLALGEHPTTPRFATAKLDGDWCMPLVSSELTTRTNWVVLESDIQPGDAK